MNRAVHTLSLAVAFTCAAIVAIMGAARGLHVGELALICGVTIAVLFILVRLIGGYYAAIITRKMAETRADRASRHLLDL